MDYEIEFSFKGDVSGLKELALCILGGGSTVLPTPILSKEQSTDLHKTVAEVIETPIEEDSPVNTDSCVDPTTGKYYTMFEDMCKALSNLTDSGQSSDVKALLNINSTNGEFGGIPSKSWGAVTKNAKDLLAKHNTKAAKADKAPEAVVEAPKKVITLDELKVAGRDYMKSNGKEAMGIILSTFEVGNISSLDQGQYERFMQALQGGN